MSNETNQIPLTNQDVVSARLLEQIILNSDRNQRQLVHAITEDSRKNRAKAANEKNLKHAEEMKQFQYDINYHLPMNQSSETFCARLSDLYQQSVEAENKSAFLQMLYKNNEDVKNFVNENGVYASFDFADVQGMIQDNSKPEQQVMDKMYTSWTPAKALLNRQTPTKKFAFLATQLTIIMKLARGQDLTPAVFLEKIKPALRKDDYTKAAIAATMYQVHSTASTGLAEFTKYLETNFSGDQEPHQKDREPEPIPSGPTVVPMDIGMVEEDQTMLFNVFPERRAVLAGKNGLACRICRKLTNHTTEEHKPRSKEHPKGRAQH